jgi:hypothetical protein
VFELAGDKVKPAVAQTLMELIAAEDDEDADEGINVYLHTNISVIWIYMNIMP